MAITTKEPPSYTPAALPLLDGGDSRYLQTELRDLKSVLDTYRLMLPQASVKPPKQLIDGMRRLSRNPWWPVSGQTVDAWVYWDAAGKVWRFDATAPTTT